MSTTQIQSRVQSVRVVLVEDEDPKVYDAKTGEDVSKHCYAILISPRQEAFAHMYDVNELGQHFLNPETHSLCEYRARVLSIRADGIWSARS